jgi:hypothetical protein
MREKRKDPAYREDKERRYLKRKLGITLEEARVMRGPGKCDICQRFRLHRCIDHKHGTNKVRGVLCQGCNVRLGWYERHLTAVTDYLA